MNVNIEFDINVDNSAFGRNKVREITRIMNLWVCRIKNMSLKDDTFGFEHSLHDINGNNVGSITIRVQE